MTQPSDLPPGQTEYPSFDRFGLGLFARRFPTVTDRATLRIGGNIEHPLTISAELYQLPRIEQVSDFHCVTTWSVRNLTWSGFRFSDFYEQIVKPRCQPRAQHHFVVLRGQDQYAVSMQLDDLLQPDVLLADTLNGEPLGVDHGAPLRLVAPAHYGYKNAKHICAIEFWQDNRHYNFPFPYPGLMDHPRGRVACEERARILPLWLIRPLYRFLQTGARKKHAKALRRFLQDNLPDKQQ
jgi:DMSO/TMAO reductase YedYZ molybdopterin-dependent catalytic subunit